MQIQVVQNTKLKKKIIRPNVCVSKLIQGPRQLSGKRIKDSNGKLSKLQFLRKCITEHKILCLVHFRKKVMNFIFYIYTNFYFYTKVMSLMSWKICCPINNAFQILEREIKKWLKNKEVKIKVNEWWNRNEL